MKKSSGASIAQYVIIIALVALAIIPVFFVTGKYIYDNFEYFVKMLKGEITSQQGISITKESFLPSIEISDQDVIDGKILAGQLGGTNEKPIEKCVDNICAIDYGEFILNGLPENFNEFIQSSGTSGGTEKLVMLMNQLADQLDEAGDKEGAEDYRFLANIGHIMASMENIFESGGKSCTASYGAGTYNEKWCFNTIAASMKFKESELAIPKEMQEAGYDFDFFISDPSNVDDFNKFLSNLRIDLARGEEEKHYTQYQNTKVTTLAYSAIELYDKIMDDPKYSDSMKGVTQELFLSINDLGYDFYGKVSTQFEALKVNMGGESYEKLVTRYDPISGEIIPGALYNPSGIQDIYNPKTSIGTNFNSALICSTGWNKDTGTKCHKP
ncbi:MAG: hypothetical protein AB1782_11905 [Cyanobacteriota bacterium]